MGSMPLTDPLLELIPSDKAEAAKTAAKAINERFESADAQLQKSEAALKRLEAENTSFSKELKEVRSFLKTSENEPIKTALQKLTQPAKKTEKGDGDQAARLQSDVDQLKKELAEQRSAKEQAESGYKQQLKAVQLKAELAEAVAGMRPKEGALGYLEADLSGIADVRDGKVVLLNPDGSTMRKDGADLTVKSYLEQTAQEKHKLFFDTGPQPSGPQGNSGGVQQGVQQTVLPGDRQGYKPGFIPPDPNAQPVQQQPAQQGQQPIVFNTDAFFNRINQPFITPQPAATTVAAPAKNSK